MLARLRKLRQCKSICRLPDKSNMSTMIDQLSSKLAHISEIQVRLTEWSNSHMEPSHFFASICRPICSKDIKAEEIRLASHLSK